jgi:hypothetical protein
VLLTVDTEGDRDDGAERQWHEEQGGTLGNDRCGHDSLLEG